jgi:lysozyme
LRAFQVAHPQLDDDGIAGPATRAALTRDAAVKAALKSTVKKGAGTAAAAGSGHMILGVHLPTVVLVGLGMIFVATLAYTAWQYRDELIGMAKQRGVTFTWL